MTLSRVENFLKHLYNRNVQLQSYTTITNTHKIKKIDVVLTSEEDDNEYILVKYDI